MTFIIIGAIIVAGGIYLMRKIGRQLSETGETYWTSHGRQIPPRNPSRRKRGL